MEKSKIRISLKTSNVSIRNKSIDLLKNTSLNTDLVVLLEKQIYNKYGKYDASYIACIQSMYDNLMDETGYLCDGLNKYRINVEDVCKLKPYELNPNKWIKMVNATIDDAKNSTTSIVANTDRYWCKKCGKNECYTYYSQDRSQDEGMTLHIICCTPRCNSHWRY